MNNRSASTLFYQSVLRSYVQFLTTLTKRVLKSEMAGGKPSCSWVRAVLMLIKSGHPDGNRTAAVLQISWATWRILDFA